MYPKSNRFKTTKHYYTTKYPISPTTLSQMLNTLNITVIEQAGVNHLNNIEKKVLSHIKDFK